MADPATFRSVPEMFLHRVAITPEHEAFRQPSPTGWTSISWLKVGERVRAIASGLRALGLAGEERCAILSGTRLEWILVDLGILCAGGATTTIYPSNTADECAYILRDSATVLVFAEDAKQLAKLAQRREQLPAVKKVIVLDGLDGGGGDWAMSLEELEALGRKADRAEPARYELVARAVEPTQLATLVYTSGTTGQPKGVELTHDCWVYEGECIAALGLLSPSDLHYLWLPLSHVFGKVLEAAQLYIGFPTAVDGRIDKLVDNLAVVKPTVVAGVPRVFEKIHNRVVTQAAEGGALRLAVFRWAIGVGRQVSALEQAGKRPGPVLRAQHLVADRLVFSRLRERFGGRLRFFVSGSAPLAREVNELFHAAGVLILEGYGLTESSAASVVNRPQKYRLGSVGLPLPGTEVRIAEADGEILLRGRGVMRGYHGLPDATREVLEPDGWLHTGDIGELDGDGFLKITDRKKDLIKTSGGKYVAPQLLEGKLKASCPYVSQVVVHGNNRNYCVALVTLDADATRAWAKEHHVPDGSLEAMAGRAEVKALVQGYLDELNRTLPSYETIKKFAILPSDFSTEGGELTASLKVKRKVVEAKYKALLDSFYEPTVSV